MVDKEKTGLARKVLQVLQARYPVPAIQLAFSDPWQLLVATILAAQCTDARVNMLTPTLFDRWPGPSELARADLTELEEVIRPAGFYHNKARHLIGCATALVEKFDGRIPSSMEELVLLPGVARKTANVVLFAGFGINAGIAVDTHVRRLSFRLGLTGSEDPVQIEKDLIRLFPQDEWGNLNLRLVQYGRDVCTARKPRCHECPLLADCQRRGVTVKDRAVAHDVRASQETAS